MTEPKTKEAREMHGIIYQGQGQQHAEKLNT